MQTRKALFNIALPPFTDGLHAETQFICDCDVGSPLRCPEHDQSSSDEDMGKSVGVTDRFQLKALRIGEGNWCFWSSGYHGLVPP
jgi:hypothetical protein